MLMAVRAEVSRCCLSVVALLLVSLHLPGIYPASCVYIVFTLL